MELVPPVTTVSTHNYRFRYTTMANHSVSSINLEPNNNAFLYALPSHTESNLSVVVTPIRKKRIEINGNYFKEKSP